MVFGFEENKQLEVLKQKHKKECFEHQEKLMKSEHVQKMARLEKLLEIAKAGGKISEMV